MALSRYSIPFFDHFRILRDGTLVTRLMDPAVEDALQLLQLPTVSRRQRQVINFVRIGLQVVQFFNRALRRHEQLLLRGQFSRRVQPFE